MFEAARAELVSDVIIPALDSGGIVIADRFADSTMAYQGDGRRLPIKQVELMNRIATQGRFPDLTFLIDIPVETAMQRIGPIQLTFELAESEDPNLRWETEGRRFEDENVNFHQRIRNSYNKMAEQDPNRWVIIDGTLGVQQIAAIVWDEVTARLNQLDDSKRVETTQTAPFWSTNSDLA